MLLFCFARDHDIVADANNTLTLVNDAVHVLLKKILAYAKTVREPGKTKPAQGLTEGRQLLGVLC